MHILCFNLNHKNYPKSIKHEMHHKLTNYNRNVQINAALAIRSEIECAPLHYHLTGKKAISAS